MDNEANKVLDFLKQNRIFSALDEKGRQRLLSKFIEVKLLPNSILFHQGDPSDSLFLLTSGRLVAEFTTEAGDKKTVGYIEVGETVGELGTLSNDPRSLTIKALQESFLLKLPAKFFIEICYQYPAIMFATVRPIVRRANSILQMLSSEKMNKHIVIVPANKNVSLEKFAEKLTELAHQFPRLLLISDYHADFSAKHLDDTLLKEKIQQLSKNKKPSHRIVYLLKSPHTALARVGFRRTYMIYVVAESHLDPQLDASVLEKIKSKRFKSADLAFILLHNEKPFFPEKMSAWLALSHFKLYHHVRMESAKDFNRLMRFLRGRAVALVLSGGGTRGWAHLGAIKALLESKVPIDIIGGTSVGAIVAACYAMHQSYKEAYDKFYQIVVTSGHSISWRSVTWPAISLFNAKFFTQSLIDACGKENIEHMWLPYFCVSCNLANSTETIHQEGVLWEKLRASASIPGIIPPMLIDGSIHLDGGLLNNLPVDIMRQFVGPKGKVIAVELNSFSPDYHQYDFPPVLTFKDALLAKLGRGLRQLKFPSFVDTFLRGIFVGSLAKAKQNSLAANVFVSLDLNKYRLLHSNPQQADRLTQIGYDETLKQIKKMQDGGVSDEKNQG